jgi:hypothetical protein
VDGGSCLEAPTEEGTGGGVRRELREVAEEDAAHAEGDAGAVRVHSPPCSKGSVAPPPAPSPTATTRRGASRVPRGPSLPALPSG